MCDEHFIHWILLYTGFEIFCVLAVLFTYKNIISLLMWTQQCCWLCTNRRGCRRGCCSRRGRRAVYYYPVLRCRRFLGTFHTFKDLTQDVPTFTTEYTGDGPIVDLNTCTRGINRRAGASTESIFKRQSQKKTRLDYLPKRIPLTEKGKLVMKFIWMDN